MKLKYAVKNTILSLLFLSITITTQAKAPLDGQFSEKPLIERYVLDELKSLREQQADLKKETIEKITKSELNSTDRAMEYTVDTTNNIFYTITIAASILVIVGWKSLSDIKKNVESITEKKVNKITSDYERRLTELEHDLKKRADELLSTQDRLTKTIQMQRIWRRASLEDKPEEKIQLYDQILKMEPSNVEALTHKADSLLDIGEMRWANSLSNKAVEIDKGYYLGYWQRACSNAQLENYNDAFDDIEKTIELSSEIDKNELLAEPMFEKLKSQKRFEDILANVN